MAVPIIDDETMEIAQSISRSMRESGRTAACAESLTSGNLASYLGAAESASEWFAGGIVAYSPAVKYTVLNVEVGPVVTAECAQQMARGVVQLTGADVAVAVTGVGGPDPEEDKPPGRVFIAVHSTGGERVEEFDFVGDDNTVLRNTTFEALKMLDTHARAGS